MQKTASRQEDRDVDGRLGKGEAGPRLRLVRAPRVVAKERFVETHALKAMLDAESARLVMIVAPPGYGKTALLRQAEQHARTNGLRTSWQDRDQCPPSAPVPTAQKKSGINRVFIDNMHGADAHAMERMLRAVLATDGETQYVFSSRTLPALDWLNLQLNGRACLLRTHDLALDPNETHAMLEAYSGAPVAPEQARLIHDQTEGWPIAVQLYGMILRRPGGIGALRRGTLRPKADLSLYLQAALYDGLDPIMRQFLRSLALLDRFCPTMLDEVIGDGSAALLERAISQNLMIVPSEGSDDWFRLHSLFREYLLQPGHGDPTVGPSFVLRKARRFCVEHGAIDDAIDYALRAGDYDEAQALMLSSAEEIVHQSGELPQILGWMRRLEASGAEMAPPLRLWKTWSLVFTLKLDQAEEELRRLEPIVARGGKRSELAHLEKLHISIAARRDDSAAVVRLAEAWLGRWGESESFHAAAVAVVLSLAHLQRLEEGAQRRALAIAREHATRSESFYAVSWVIAVEALVEFEYGRPALARELIDRGLQAANGTKSGISPIAGTLGLVAARIYLEFGELDRVRDLLSHGYASMETHGLIDTHLAGFEALVRVTEATCGVDAALAEIHLQVRRGLRFDVSGKLLAAHLMLRARRVKDARALFDAAFLRCQDGYRHITTDQGLGQEQNLLIGHCEAWLLFAENAVEPAERLVQQILAKTESHGRRSGQMSLLLLKSAIQKQQGKLAHAQTFRRAIKLGAEAMLYTPIVDFAWALRPLFPALQDVNSFPSEQQGYVASLLEKCGLLAGRGEVLDDPCEHLTAREREVLQMLDSGMTAQRVADALAVSLATAKWHMQNIYNKLGVRNRTGALALARNLALI